MAISSLRRINPVAAKLSASATAMAVGAVAETQLGSQATQRRDLTSFLRDTKRQKCRELMLFGYKSQEPPSPLAELRLSKTVDLASGKALWL